MTEKSDVVLANSDVGYDSLPKSKRKVGGGRKKDDVAGRRTSRGRQVAKQLVAKISTAAASAANWHRPAGSTSETTSGADDSGFASTGRRVGRTATSWDQDASSWSTTAMSSSLVDGSDRRAIGRVPGAVGIINHHNTCFINAVVQCLSNTPAFVIHALKPDLRSRHHHDVLYSTASRNSRPVQSHSSADGELGKELSRLLESMWRGRYKTDSSKAFHRAVRRLASGWYGGDDQNDAQEFAAWMLNRLRDEQFGAFDDDDCSRHPTVNNVTVR